MAYETLLSPFEIGGRTLKNRAVSTAHGEQWAAGGLLTDHHLDYYARRAQGGVGLMITFGSAPVSPAASTANTVSLWDPRNEGRLRELATRVHAHGTILLAQASHRGPRERPAEIDAVLQAPSAPMGADKLTYQGVPQVLTEADIAGIVDDFAAAAARLERCGYDGIEVTALGTHLIEQFWSPAMNRREDGYGGSLANRMRFAFEVLAAVDAATSPDFLIAFRMSVDPQTDLLGLTTQDLLEIALAIEATGTVDLFDLSGGSGANTATHAGVVPTDTFPVMPYADLTRRWKQRIATPILMAGRVLHPDHGEAALTSGACDLVAMTRAMIADPDVVAKTMAGHVDRIRPCIAINEGCRRVTLGRSLACSVNPEVAQGDLGLYPPTGAADRRITVIGAGPGGMEAARVAAERGFDVTVMERADRVGGQMIDYAAMMGAPHLLDHVRWLERELARLGVRVVLNAPADGRSAPEDGGRVIVAVGARTVLPPEARGLSIPAVTDVDVLHGRDGPATRVVVYDAEGRQRGAMIAARLAEAGASVILAFPNDAPCEHLEPPNRPAIFRRLARGGVTIRAHSTFAGAEGGAPAFRDGWTDELFAMRDCELAVFAGYREAVSWPGAGTPIGDHRAPRLMRNAVSEATKAALLL